MPIDPYHLDADRRKPRREVRDWTQSRVTAAWIMLIGVLFLATCTLGAFGQPALRGPFVMWMFVVHGLAMTIMTFLIGSREGLLGAYFFWQRPFSSLDPESHPKSPVARAVWALIFLGIIAGGLVMMFAKPATP